MAYADLIPVIDGGIALDTFGDGRLRNGIWRAHTLVPGRSCMACNGQLLANEVSLDKLDLLDDPVYIEGAVREAPSRQNVAALSASVSSALLAQFVSLVAHPGGRGVPAPLRYILSTHLLEQLAATTGQYCAYENTVAAGDRRTPIAERRDDWRKIGAAKAGRTHAPRLRLAAKVKHFAQALIDRLLCR